MAAEEISRIKGSKKDKYFILQSAANRLYRKCITLNRRKWLSNWQAGT
jgi:hypothetical protein